MSTNIFSTKTDYFGKKYTYTIIHHPIRPSVFLKRIDNSDFIYEISYIITAIDPQKAILLCEQAIEKYEEVCDSPLYKLLKE